MKRWNLNNFAPEFYQICAFSANIKKSSIILESLHLFHKMSRLQEIVVENCETVMEKSWGRNCKSLWELFKFFQMFSSFEAMIFQAGAVAIKEKKSCYRISNLKYLKLPAEVAHSAKRMSSPGSANSRTYDLSLCEELNA